MAENEKQDAKLDAPGIGEDAVYDEKSSDSTKDDKKEKKASASDYFVCCIATISLISSDARTENLHVRRPDRSNLVCHRCRLCYCDRYCITAHDIGLRQINKFFQ